MKKQDFYITKNYRLSGPDRIEFMKVEGEILKYKAPDRTDIQIGVTKGEYTNNRYGLTEITTGCQIPVKMYKVKWRTLMQLTPELLQIIADTLKQERNKEIALALKRYKEEIEV